MENFTLTAFSYYSFGYGDHQTHGIVMYGGSHEKENRQINNRVVVPSEAALRLNFDKKVRFGEQLAFKIGTQGGEPGLFESEVAKPIEFKNNFKVPSAAKVKGNGGVMPKAMKKKTFDGLNKKLSAKKTQGNIGGPSQPFKGDFNLDTRP